MGRIISWRNQFEYDFAPALTAGRELFPLNHENQVLGPMALMHRAVGTGGGSQIAGAEYVLYG